MDKKTESNTADPGVDLARFLNLPIYFFAFDPVLVEAPASPVRAFDREALKSMAERCLAEISNDEVLITAATGFYLIVHSASGEAADEIADQLNRTMLTAMFGEGAPIPERFRTLFRALHAKAHPVPANEDTSPSLKPPAATDTRGSADIRLLGPARESRDAYSELALRGQLPRQKIELLFEPVHDLLRGRSTTFFCTPAFCVDGSPVIRGYKAFQGANQSELPYIDRAILAHALKFARRLAQAGVFTTIGAPVSFETLTWSRGREFYQEALRAAGVPDYPSLLLCIKNLPLGITVSRLAELVSYLRPLVKRLLVHVPEPDSALLASGYLGANGFLLSVPAKQSPTQTERVATWFARACETQTALSCMDQIDNSDELGAVRRASVRFGLGPVFGPTQFRGTAEPIEIESFMRAAARAAQNEARNVHRFGPRREARERTLRPN